MSVFSGSILQGSLISNENHSGLLIPADKSRSNNLDFIRFVLAVSVLYCHCYVLYYGTEDTVEPMYVWSGKQTSLGSFAVNFFFTISGYLILCSWYTSTGVLSFLKKRILRIYPGFIIASLLCLLVFAPLGTADYFMPLGYWNLYYHNINFSSVLFNLLNLSEPAVPWTLKSVPIADSINAPLWTIRYEFICYLSVPMLYFAGVFRKRAFVLILFLVLYISQLIQVHGNVYLFGWNEYLLIGKPDFLPRFMTYFTAGMCFYLYKDIIPRSLVYFVICLLLLLITIVYKGLNWTQPICGSYVLFYCAFSNTFKFRNFSKSGDFSFGVYVYAWPIQQLVIVYFEKVLDLSLLFILTFVGTMAMAYWSWHYVEKPFLKLKYKLNDNESNGKKLVWKFW